MVLKKKEEPKKDAPKKEVAKKDATKKDAPRKEAPKSPTKSPMRGTNKKGQDEPDFSDGNPLDSQVDVKSTWKSNLPPTTSSAMMTEQQAVGNASTQTTSHTSIGIQTGQTQAQLQAQLQAQAKIEDPKGLKGFMDSVLGMVKSEIKKVEEEHEVLEPLNRIVDDKQEPAVCTFELTAFPDQATLEATGTNSAAAIARSKLVVTCLSWSATGQSVAASYGRYDIPGWCEDRGALATWNLARGNVNPTKAEMCIDVDNCLMSCAFHPEHPALIAGGTFNGDVYVWDLSLEGDMQRAKSDALSDLRHREPICSMVWQYSVTEYNKYGNKTQAYRLITLGADGLVMIWTWHKLEAALYGYKLSWPQPITNQKIMYGGGCMGFQGDPQQRLMGGIATFMVGTEGGKIFKCYMDLNDAALKEFAKAAAANERIEMRCPIKDGDYSPHAGAVYGLDCSPFHRDMFLTAGFDGCIHLYHSLKGKHLMEVVPSQRQLFDVEWSPVRPMVFAAAGGDGRVFFYDLLRVKGMVTPSLVLDASPDGSPIFACAFNKRQPDLFASGGSSGIQVWRLPESMSGVRKGEEAVLRRLAAADDFEEALRQLQQHT